MFVVKLPETFRGFCLVEENECLCNVSFYCGLILQYLLTYNYSKLECHKSVLLLIQLCQMFNYS